jgi:predicted ATPase/DNA-binding SARP family transcriptional activator
MECGVLGDLRVLDDGADRTPPGRRSRDLLVALLLRPGQAVDPAVLLDQVWGPQAAGLSVAVVHTQVARLRRALGAHRVVTTETGYRLGTVDLDADRFAALVAQARDGGDPDRSIELLRRALRLWRADRPFTDVSEELVAPEAVRLSGLRTAALELLAERLLAKGDPASCEEAAGVASRLTGADPLRERGYELGMRAAAATGHRGEALAVYERLRTTLRDELGIDPGPAARALHLQLLEPGRALRPPAGPLLVAGGADVRTSAPPAARTRLVGREHDLAQVAALVAARRVVTIVGLGGVGKTRLLSELAGVLDPAAGRAYLDLGALAEFTSGELAEAVGEALGRATGPGDPLVTLPRLIGTRRLVLMLDEAERNPGEVAGLVRALVDGCPAVTAVLTSRTRLGLVGEVVYPLAPLACPPRDAGAAAAGRSPAVVLLRERIADHTPGLPLDDAAVLRLGDYARRVDGLPLALELLAAQSSTRSLDELAAVLDAPLRLESEEADRSARNRTMHTTIAWSVDRLPVAQRTALYRLAAFVGPFDADAARAVGGPDLDLDRSLRALVREALIHTERTPDRLLYRMLRPVRDLAHHRLAGSGDLGRVTLRHRAWYAARWRAAPRSDALLLDVRDQYADYVAALSGALEARDAPAVADLTMTLGKGWMFADNIGPGLRWSARALASGLLTPPEHARVTTVRAALQVQYAPDEVRDDLRRAVPVLTAHDDTEWLVTAHMILALERHTAGRHEEALDRARLAVAAARGWTEERRTNAESILALVAAPIAPDEAERAARGAWAQALRTGSAAAVATVASNLSWAHLTMGRPDVASDLVDRAVVRLPTEDLPEFLRLQRAWARLRCGRAADAVADFAVLIASSAAAPDNRRSAELYLGAACALAGTGHPCAPELLAGALAMAGRAGLALLGWQEDAVAQARGHTAHLPSAPWSASLAAGPDLARLVSEAVSG